MGLDRMEKLTMAILFTLDFRALRLFLHSEVFADEAEFQKKLFHALHIQAGGVMAVIVLYTGNILIACLLYTSDAADE